MSQTILRFHSVAGDILGGSLYENCECAGTSVEPCVGIGIFHSCVQRNVKLWTRKDTPLGGHIGKMNYSCHLPSKGHVLSPLSFIDNPTYAREWKLPIVPELCTLYVYYCHVVPTYLTGLIITCSVGVSGLHDAGSYVSDVI